MPPQIDPQTGERVGAVNIDPQTGERVTSAPKQQTPQRQFTADEASGGSFLPQVEQEAFGPQTAIGDETPEQFGLRAMSNFGGAAAAVVPEMLLHPVKAVQSVAHMAQAAQGNPTGMVSDLTPLVQSAKENPTEAIPQALGSLVGGVDVGELAGEAIPKIGEAIPSKARAGQTLQDIRAEAQNVPAYPQKAWPEIQRFQELGQRGGASSKPVTQLNRRLTTMVRNPNSGAFNFPEARDFYSNVSSQSSEDMSRLNPVMRRQMGAIRQGMHQDLTDAASQVGRGADYDAAVKEYAKAMQLRKVAINAAKYGVPLTGLGIAGHYLKDLIPQR